MSEVSARLGELVEPPQSGVSVNSEDRPHMAGEIGILKTSAVFAGQFRPNENKAVLPLERGRVSVPVLENSIIVSRMNTPELVGASCYVGENHETLFLPDRLWRVLPRTGRKTNMRWLSHVLLSHEFRRHVDTYATGTSGSMKNLSKTNLLDFSFEEPAPEHQAKIAEVLDTLDAAIRGTEAVVAKLRAMKQGLLHDLLTRGIDANGDLRPPQPGAPHLYYQTPLGWLPRGWVVREVQDLLAPVDPPMRSGPFGSALLKEELVSAGIPFLGIDNVHFERFDRDYKRFVTPSKFQQLRRYAVRPADLMITIMGTVGRCCVVPDDVGEALSSKHTWTISLDQTKYSPYLAMLQVNYCDWVLRHFSKDQQGGTMSAIRSETIRSTLLPVPPRPEQDSIEAIFKELSNRLRDEATLLDKLRLQKSGLMDDLLTGQVSVSPLLSTEGAAHGA